MLPGMAKMKDQIASANLDEKVIKRQRAIILSMTQQERRNPDILKASRKKRIAAGSGTRVEDVNRLLKQHRGIADMMKQMGNAKRGPLSQMASAFGLGGGMPVPSPEQIAELQKQAAGAGGMPKIPELPPGLLNNPSKNLPGLPGLGGAKIAGRFARSRRQRIQSIWKEEITRSFVRKENNVSENSSRPWWRQEAPLLSRRRRGFAHAA